MCDKGGKWMCLKHWQSAVWWVEFVCNNPDHWLPNCQVSGPYASKEEAEKECKEINSWDK